MRTSHSDLRPVELDTINHHRPRYSYNPALGNLARDGSPSITPGLLDRWDTSKFLGISPRLLHELRRSGKLLPILIASKVLYRRSDLQAFIDSQSPAPIATTAQEASA